MSGRLEPLNAQLQTSWFMLSARLEGLSDEEYLWEPLPGSPAVRVHPEAKWKRDQPRPEHPPARLGRRRLAFLERAAAAWIQAVAGLGDADLDKPLCDWPRGPPGTTNRELIATGAEISLLRDLYRPG